MSKKSNSVCCCITSSSTSPPPQKRNGKSPSKEIPTNDNNQTQENEKQVVTEQPVSNSQSPAVTENKSPSPTTPVKPDDVQFSVVRSSIPVSPNESTASARQRFFQSLSEEPPAPQSPVRQPATQTPPREQEKKPELVQEAKTPVQEVVVQSRQQVVQSSPVKRKITDLPTQAEIEELLAEAREALKRDDLSPSMAAELTSLVARLEAVTNRLESVSTKSGGGAATGGDDVLAPFVTAYDEIVNGPVKSFIDLGNKIGGDVQTQAALVNDVFSAQRAFLVVASKSKSPSQDVLIKLLEPTSSKLQAIEEFVSVNRRSDYFNHLSGVSSSVPSLGWVTVSPTPGPFVKDMADAGQFYLNRVLKDFRDKDNGQDHVAWARAWTQIFKELQAYIKQYHTTGLTWNPQGVDASSANASSVPPPPARGAPPPPPPGGAPPPPPPPGPPPPSSQSDDTESKRNALFADLNKGTDITKGLRKVGDDQKTHKNPNLRLQTPQPYKPSVSPKPAVKAFGTKKVETVKPPICALEGKKWLVEYQSGNKNLVISDTNMKQTVYIFKCDNSTIQIKGKVNSIVMDSCKKSAVVFEDAISSFDVVNSQSVQAQVTARVPTVNIDKTDGCMVYLSKDCQDTEVVTAKSSEMNILLPDDSGEFKEFALPEQFKSKWDGSKFVTGPSDIV